ncbi:hypothetical protein M758_12G135300 [Ceratodon purpureus]|nr:hypothetical protein M758_12G135300 [Ceratodon purpureus]KAG0599199.1 hypothetical protein M758_12G135300 [Ceratodon purpureus]KAG0599200.1 hypothetical protein M758_12G135300 [Ceratodon purpureus]
MACMGRTMSRSLLSTSRSAFRACKTTASEAAAAGMKGRSPCAPSAAPSPSPGSFFQTRRPASYIFRLPGEVACVQSLMPLHSVTASSRLVAQLSTTAGALFQGGVWLIDDN